MGCQARNYDLIQTLKAKVHYNNAEFIFFIGHGWRALWPQMNVLGIYCSFQLSENIVIVHYKRSGTSTAWF